MQILAKQPSLTSFRLVAATGHHDLIVRADPRPTLTAQMRSRTTQGSMLSAWGDR